MAEDIRKQRMNLSSWFVFSVLFLSSFVHFIHMLVHKLRWHNYLPATKLIKGGRNFISNGSTRLRCSAGVEDDKSPFFITTPIYYVNGQPHLGHAYTSVACDMIARFQRADGREVFFLTGTDEHGQKVEQSATLAGKTPIQLADEVSSNFRNLANLLGCSYDDYIRTTEDRHKKAVKALWEKLESNGQIYLGAYEGWYSIRDEAFYSENELINGKAPTGADVTWVKEESYFFRLSQYTNKLLEYYNSNVDFIAPKSRRNEVVSFVSQEGGLKDLSISRTTFSWGLPVPSNSKHVVYVWLDALANYITAVGYPDETDSKFKKFWPASLHVVGKDILRFHTVFWPAFLMAADLPLPKRIFAHGWWTKDGEKMSKSLGNVLDPYELLSTYGKDYLRYFLVAEVIFGNDGDFTHEQFVNRINSDLANDIGNLAQRVLTFINKNCNNHVPQPTVLLEGDRELLNACRYTYDKCKERMNSQDLKGFCESIVELSKLGNKYIDVNAPWTLRKQGDLERMNTVLYTLAETIRVLAVLLSPITPSSSDNLLHQLGIEIGSDLRRFSSIKSNQIDVNRSLGASIVPVFPKLEQKESKEKSSNGVYSTAHPDQKLPDFSDIGINLSKEELAVKIVDTGVIIRDMKASKADKDALRPFVQELLAYKERYKVANNGIGYDQK